jgi:hypothetical protein
MDTYIDYIRLIQRCSIVLPAAAAFGSEAAGFDFS